MKLIKPSFEIIEQHPGELGMMKHIETCGRVAWKSEDKITDDSYVKFIDMLRGVNHGSVLEHGTVYLYLPVDEEGIEHISNRYVNNKFSKVNKFSFVTTNFRVIFENNWIEDLIYMCEPTEHHEKRVTVRFICDRGVSHEFVRHRVMSFTQESTRYCNYSKDKYDGQVTYVIPEWVDIDEVEISDSLDMKRYAWNAIDIGDAKEGNELQHGNNGKYYLPKFDKFTHVWLYSMLHNETEYISLINNGYKPQQARAVLPNSLKTELIMTGFISDWEHFFMLRTAAGAHPQARELAVPLQEKFKELNLI